MGGLPLRQVGWDRPKEKYFSFGMSVGELELEYNKMGWETTGSIQGPKKKEGVFGG
jgi:hypothetical protein